MMNTGSYYIAGGQEDPLPTEGSRRASVATHGSQSTFGSRSSTDPFNTPYRKGKAGVGNSRMDKVNGFVLSGGLAALGHHRSRSKVRKKLRRAVRCARSKDEVHTQLRAIDEQYRCDVETLEATYQAERRRIMTALKLTQILGL